MALRLRISLNLIVFLILHYYTRMILISSTNSDPQGSLLDISFWDFSCLYMAVNRGLEM